MQIGTVIRWDNFQSPQYGGRRKPRWFICLGDTGKLNSPTLYFLHSTTKIKRNKPSLFLPKSRYPFFHVDCHLYFNESPYHRTKNELNNPNVRILGTINNDDLVVIYERLKMGQEYCQWSFKSEPFMVVKSEPLFL